MRVLVLGGTGWVGHHIVRELQAAGHTPVVCSRGRKGTYNTEVPAGIERVVADKTVAEDMARVLAEPYDAIIDSVPTEASIGHVVQFALRLKRYLHCSSTGGYAPLPVVPGDETLPYDQFMGGWAQKGVVDSLVLDLHHRQGFPATVIRPSYITGPGMLPLDNLGGRRQDFLADVLAGKPLELPNDGQALLHPVHVRDLARSFVLALQTPQSVGQIYNICLDRAVPLTRYLAITAQALDAPEPTTDFQPVETILARHGESIHKIGLHFLATHMCYDIRKAREQLGYRPSMSTEEAIEETARWGRQHLGI
jgi:nucleoside-diphosphate-sugar epimerase